MDKLLEAILSGQQTKTTSPFTGSIQSILNSIPRTPTLPPITTPLLPARVTSVRLTPTTEAQVVKRVQNDTARIIRQQINQRKGSVVPTTEDVAFNEAKEIDAAIMHIDIRNSSNIIPLLGNSNALKIYQIFHSTAVSVIRQKHGKIRTFAGDRVAAFFDESNYKRSKSVETALLLETIMDNVVKPVLQATFGYNLDYGLGIDCGAILVGKIGQYGSSNNDLVWAGGAVNIASKLADYGAGIYISKNVHDFMAPNLKDVGMIWTGITDPKLGSFYRYNGITKPLPK